ncbi:MAG: PD-(D/E)XK nuclease family protein, partial [Candidatus Limnocylindria bacterium]
RELLVGLLRRLPRVGQRLARLGRALEVQGARGSAALTEFDGNLASVAASSARIADGITGAPISATALEKWAACPFRYFLDRVLKVRATENPEEELGWSLDPARRGSAVHAILQRFFTELDAAGRLVRGLRYTPADERRLEEIAAEEFRPLETLGWTGHRLAWENLRAALLLDLRTFLAADTRLHLDRSWVPARFEQRFGSEGGEAWPAAAVELASGAAVRLRGRIDRVDVAPDPARPDRARVIDYKTGRAFAKKELAADPVAAGMRLQHAAYAEAARAWLAERGVPDAQIEAAYWFTSTKGEFEERGPSPGAATEARLRDVLEVADEAVRSGAFPQVPGEEAERPGRSTWENCAYCPFDRVCPSGREQLWARKEDDPASAIRRRLPLPGAAG